MTRPVTLFTGQWDRAYGAIDRAAGAFDALFDKRQQAAST